ncbi:hypothetical protein EZV62_024015 [Acer yangbiense]|uniref:Integrase catalytic domain-containing protein n=1 Tax=Acer yangbiense TaxID=1000413 RepID=A0A5C7H3K1_9ROSI|nr:hypothetical protein EZV62_024015 [Acer yangbiense]
MAYESRKWNEAEQRYSAHEKEMAAMVHCLDTWRHYMLGTKFTMHRPGQQNQVADALSRIEVVQGYVSALATLQTNFLDRLRQIRLSREKFSTVDEFRSIIVVVDRFSKYAVFLPAPHACLADKVVELFFRYVVKTFGVPNDIVSNRDARFIGNFWTYLFKLMGFELKFSIANHP